MDNKQKVIVSLTSFPEAIPYAVQSIRSIIAGSVLPDKIVLYLDTQKFSDGAVPMELETLKKVNSFFEVRFTPDEICSYKKLIPALKDFPDDIIVTVDDDIMYHHNMLRDLLRMHKRVPDAIAAHRVRKIRPDAPYSKWKKYKWYDFVFRKLHFSRLSMQTGVGGVLYPPHSLDESMLDPRLFMEIAPTTDDLWFWAAAVSRGTYIVPLPNGKSHASEIGKPEKLSLKTINLKPGDDRNRQALDRILERFPSIRQKIEKDG